MTQQFQLPRQAKKENKLLLLIIAVIAIAVIGVVGLFVIIVLGVSSGECSWKDLPIPITYASATLRFVQPTFSQKDMTPASFKEDFGCADHPIFQELSGMTVYVGPVGSGYMSIFRPTRTERLLPTESFRLTSVLLHTSISIENHFEQVYLVLADSQNKLWLVKDDGWESKDKKMGLEYSINGIDQGELNWDDFYTKK